MNAIEKVVHTFSELDAAKAVHTALLDAEPHPEQPYDVGLNVSAIESRRTPARRDASTRTVVHVRGPDRQVLDDVRSVAAARRDRCPRRRRSRQSRPRPRPRRKRAGPHGTPREHLTYHQHHEEIPMKTMTCRQLGGPCDLALSGETADDVIKAQDRHLREAVRGGDAAHEPAHEQMKGRWRHPVRSMGWYRETKKAFADLPGA